MLLKGVNLGGWLVLERWITPSLFEGMRGWDEYSFCIERGNAKLSALKNHRNSFITEDDFKWIGANGLNAVRIPLGYWIFGDIEPFVGSIEKLDWAIKTAEKHNLKVIICLHGAAGSQNGYKHSGKEGKILWHKRKKNIEQTLKTIEKIAQRYIDAPNLEAIELLNEPSSKIKKSTLLNFYQQTYEIIRKYSNDIAVIISDGFEPQKWQVELTGNDYKNVWLDAHLYQCFDANDKNLDLQGHLQKIDSRWLPLIQAIQAKRPMIIGEWSAALPPRTFDGMDENQKALATKKYTSKQLTVFNHSSGWFYWTYKTEQEDSWNFKFCKESGLIV